MLNQLHKSLGLWKLWVLWEVFLSHEIIIKIPWSQTWKLCFLLFFRNLPGDDLGFSYPPVYITRIANQTPKKKKSIWEMSSHVLNHGFLRKVTPNPQHTEFSSASRCFSSTKRSFPGAVRQLKFSRLTKSLFFFLPHCFFVKMGGRFWKSSTKAAFLKPTFLEPWYGADSTHIYHMGKQWCRHHPKEDSLHFTKKSMRKKKTARIKT